MGRCSCVLGRRKPTLALSSPRPSTHLRVDPSPGGLFIVHLPHLAHYHRSTNGPPPKIRRTPTTQSTVSDASMRIVCLEHLWWFHSNSQFVQAPTNDRIMWYTLIPSDRVRSPAPHVSYRRISDTLRSHTLSYCQISHPQISQPQI